MIRLIFVSIFIFAFQIPDALADGTTSVSKDESHLPPGFRSNISIDPNLAIVFENLKGTRNDFTLDEVFEILAGRSVGEFHLKYNFDERGQAIGGSMLPAWKCDGGYAFLNAYLVKLKSSYHTARAPADTIDFGQLNKESPSMTHLMAGMQHFMRGEYGKAENRLVKGIFVNMYGESLGIRKSETYLTNPSSRDEIIGEVNNIISNMKYSETEYKKCDPSTDSTKLMLAQWGAWALTNNFVVEMEKTGNRTRFLEAKKINNFEINLRDLTLSPKLRAKEDREFYISNENTNKFDF